MNYAVRRIGSYGSHPWAIINLETNQECIGPDVEIDHPFLGKTWITGQMYYRRKRDAQLALNALMKERPCKKCGVHQEQHLSSFYNGSARHEWIE